MAPYSWSVSRISPGDASRSDEATRLTAAVTLTVKTSRRGSPPTNRASASRADHNSGGRPRRRKSIGSSASRRRSSVTRSKTTRGDGPKEPVLRFVTVGSSIIRARASVQKSEGMEGPFSGRERIGCTLFGTPDGIKEAASGRREPADEAHQPAHAGRW